jgi:hypothetical protein
MEPIFRYHLRPFEATGKKNKLVEISRNYLVIFNENSGYLTSTACNFLTKDQTRHLFLFSESVRKN